MQFVYRLGAVLIGTAAFCASAFVLVMVGANSGAIAAIVGLAALGAALITWGVVRVWRWICGQDDRPPVQRRMTRKEYARYLAITDKASRKPRSPQNVVSESDLAWLQAKVGDLRDGQELIHLVRQSNTLNTLKPEDVAEFMEKHRPRP